MLEVLGGWTGRHRPVLRRILRRVAVVALAAVLFTAGFAGLLLPLIPGLVFLAGGIALLSREFRWVEDRIARARRSLPRKSPGVAVRPSTTRKAA